MPENTRKHLAGRRTLAVGAAAVAAAALLATVSRTATEPHTHTGTTNRQEAAEGPSENAADAALLALARRDRHDPLARGRADAPVVLIEYADFTCGFCGKFARDTEPELVKKYVADGTLRVEWRNFPIFGSESEAAARAAWAAGRQGRFWQFHQAAYADGAKEKGFGAARLDALARQAGVPDLDRFRRDRDSDAAHRAVGKDRDEAYALGATSTPSFLVGGRPIAGAQPAATFEQAIESAKVEAAR
ncbi:DsbA family protein [Streptomyces beihaiensis]|uniref:Thioredoxin domain-containing protein n=1 Tax=Streptomyces beihaiensis TaxID=2984495 RepID=A0ABT3TPP7_9ACTN|nr:thioredoxin domain-containing protein [Streptomyces beihaiensis]MCX3059013.1 thioredoxin domain-containing protein [Streptomyces beihaiensis]